jgi:protein TonB
MIARSPQPRRRRRFRVPRGFAGDTGDPYANVLDLNRAHGRVAIAVVSALAFHISLVSIAVIAPRVIPSPPPAAKEILVMAEPPAPPPPPSTLAPEPPTPPPAQARRVPSSPRPAAAQAGKVIARAPDPSEPLDLSGFDLVTGKSETFAGGFTASAGTSQKAVLNPQASARGTGDARPSLARPAQPGRHDWACSWPEDAQESDLRDARVGIRVSVASDGAPDSVEVVSTPGPSFGEAARRCALSEQYKPALDASGRRIPGTTSLFLVHFLR